jgi:hypothetical protein
LVRWKFEDVGPQLCRFDPGDAAKLQRVLPRKDAEPNVVRYRKAERPPGFAVGAHRAVAPARRGIARLAKRRRVEDKLLRHGRHAGRDF